VAASWGVGPFLAGIPLHRRAEPSRAAGYPSDATDNAVQASIVAARYQQVSTGFPATGTPYTITNVNSGKVAEPSGCATANGTGIAWAYEAGILP
jgi:hypothetical protein